MNYHPNIIANFFVNKSFDTGELISPMKLVKLVYVAHGWYLALADKPLISEPVQAWKYGPVVPSVYTAFRRYGGDSITSITHSYTGPDIDEKIVVFLNKIWEVYKEYTAIQLSTITHQQNTPWSMTWEKNHGQLNLIIPNEIIKEHYKTKVNA